MHVNWRRRWKYAVAAVLALPVLLTPLVRVKTGFSIVGETEAFTFMTAGAPTSNWPVARAVLVRSANGAPERFTGSIQFADSVHVHVERMSLGPVRALVEADRPDGSAGTLRDETEQFVATLGPQLWVVIDSVPERAQRGETVILPFTARAELGGRLGHETSPSIPLLRSGTVRMIGTSMLVGRGFEAGVMPLEPGDELKVLDPHALASGYVVADDRAALNAVLRVRTRTLRVDRLGGSLGYNMSLSWFEILRNDPVVTSIWAVAAFLFAAQTFLDNRNKEES